MGLSLSKDDTRTKERVHNWQILCIKFHISCGFLEGLQLRPTDQRGARMGIPQNAKKKVVGCE